MTNQERDHKKRKKLPVLSKNTFSSFSVKGAVYFHFILGPTNYIANLDLKKKKKKLPQCLLQQRVAM